MVDDDEVAASELATDLFEGSSRHGDADVGEEERSPTPTSDGDAPLGDLAASVRDQRRATEDDADLVEDLFEEIDVGDLDGDDAWAALEGVRDDDVSVSASAHAIPVDRPDPRARRDDHLVSKREFCQQCPYFTAPPETACTHDGTEIVEVVDADQFRVRGCPMVDREKLDRFD